MSEVKFLFPVGRYVGGSLYKQQPVTENDGKTPKLDKQGKQRFQFSFAVAVPKTSADWRQTDWGAKVFRVGQDGFPQGEWQSPSFAWKITDGDSTIPNKKGKKPCDREGYRGNWVIWFSSEAQAPRLTGKYGSREDTLTYNDGVERIKPGHLIEVLGVVKDNKPSPSPGVYMNYDTVAHNDATTPVIELREETDTSAVGFGGGQPPAAAPQAPAAAPQAPAAAPQAPAAPTPVAPNTTYMAPPAPQAPAAPPAGPQMTATATTTYEEYIKAGWTDATLRQHGLMV